MKERPILFSAPMVHALLDGRKTQTRRVVKPQPRMGVKGDGSVISDDYFVWDDTLRKPFCLPMVPMLRLEMVEQCPYGYIGDRLWVRENWHIEGRSTIGDSPESIVCIAYRPCSQRAVAGGWSQDSREFNRPTKEMVCPTTPTFKKDGSIRWFPSIHMPRWASRLSLEITEVRVQRLQDISDEDAESEGVDTECPGRCSVGWVNDVPGGRECPQPFCGDSPVAHFKRLWESINGPGSWEKNPWVWALSFKVVTA